MDDQPRPAATSPDDYTLSIEDAVALYERAGLPRTPRTIQRYCGNGHLDCRRVEIPYGEKHLITPASVAKHIAYIEETRQTLAGRDEPRPVAPAPQQETPAPTEPRLAPTGRDQPRQKPTPPRAMSRGWKGRTRFCASRSQSKTCRSRTSPSAPARPTI